MSYTIKATKPRKPRQSHKTRQSSEKRVFPKYREGWSTLDYVAAYHAANASVSLTTVEYVCR